MAKGRRIGTLDIPVRNPEDILAKAEGAGITTFTIDLPKDDAEFLERYAKHRNKTGDLELAEDKADKKLKRGITWTRKSLSEYLLRAEVAALREQFAPTEKLVGPLPESDDAIAQHATRAFNLKKKKSA